MKPRPAREFPPVIPIKLVPMTGFRDQQLRITYLPWSDVALGVIGWEIVPDRSHRTLPVLVYIVPVVGSHSFEIHCHLADEDPDPEADPLLGSITIPADMLGIDES